MRSVPGVGVLLVVVACGAWGPASATQGQRRHPRADTTTVPVARNVFAQVARAAIDLSSVQPVEGDANGELRAWDARWRRRLDRLPYDIWYYGYEDCTRTEVRALLSSVPVVQHTRRNLTNFARGRRDHAWVEDPRPRMAHDLAELRELADHARKRERSGMICADLRPDQSFVSARNLAPAVFLLFAEHGELPPDAPSEPTGTPTSTAVAPAASSDPTVGE